MRRRSLSLVALTAALSVVTAGCGTATNDDTAVLDGEILIGVSLEKNGPASILGRPQEQALQVALDKINTEGVLGKRLRLVINDNRSNDAEAVRQVTAFADNPDVVGIVGPGTTATTLPVLPIIEERRIPLISMAGSDAIVTPVDQHRFSFKTPQNGPEIVGTMMREFRLLNIKKVATLVANNQFGEYGASAMRGAAEQAKIEVTSGQKFNESDKDYSAQVKAMIESQPDAIVVSAIMPFAGIAAKNIKDSDYSGRVFFDPSAGSDVFLEGAGNFAEGMYMVHASILAANHITATTPSVLAQKEFFAAYTQRHGSYSGYASYAADALNLLVAAIRKANSEDRQAIRDALETLEHDGLTGTFKFSAENHGGASADGLTVLTVKKGGWILAP